MQPSTIGEEFCRGAKPRLAEAYGAATGHQALPGNLK
jgi:hypothetical protein